MINGINHIHRLREIADNYEVYIFDLWGVVHDGVTAFQSSIEVMKKLKAQSKRLRSINCVKFNNGKEKL
ncbi:MAG: hypothetical protein ACKOAD_08220 [Gammaproteobacteria bacterium]